MKREYFKEGSTYAGLGLLFSGIASILAKDYGNGIMQVVAGIGAVLHK